MQYLSNLQHHLKAALKGAFLGFFIVHMLCLPFTLMDNHLSYYGCLVWHTPTVTYVQKPDAILIDELNSKAKDASFHGIYDLSESVLKQNAKQQAWKNHRGRMRQILGY